MYFLIPFRKICVHLFSNQQKCLLVKNGQFIKFCMYINRGFSHIFRQNCFKVKKKGKERKENIVCTVQLYFPCNISSKYKFSIGNWDFYLRAKSRFKRTNECKVLFLYFPKINICIRLIKSTFDNIVNMTEKNANVWLQAKKLF